MRLVKKKKDFGKKILSLFIVMIHFKNVIRKTFHEEFYEKKIYVINGIDDATWR